MVSGQASIQLFKRKHDRWVKYLFATTKVVCDHGDPWVEQIVKHTFSVTLNWLKMLSPPNIN